MRARAPGLARASSPALAAGSGPGPSPTPLVELVRHASFGFEATDPIRVVALIVLALILWRVAIRQMTKRLID